MKIIFPEGLDSQASRIAGLISAMDRVTRQTLGERARKIPIVLQNQTTVSNAYVGLGPFRSEFLLTPLQNSFELGSLPWIDQLTIHEFRHVQQYNNFNVGLSKVFHVLFGQEGQALANNAVLPNWFFEGDAVFNETLVSRQGRGRLPFFFYPYRALWREDKNYSWMKLRNGSYRDFVPDHYALGYLLVAYGREKYGNAFWRNVSHDAAAFKGLFYPFQKAVERYSGNSFAQFRNDALQYFKRSTNDTTAHRHSHVKDRYASYEYPCYIDSNAVVYVKSSYREPPAFYLLDGRGERKIRTKDVSFDNYFSCASNNIVYASYRSDERWGYRDYSEIQILNVATGKQRTLTRRSKYFSPDISSDGKRIVAVEVGAGGRSSLAIINAQTGAVMLRVPDTGRLFYTYPKFYGDADIIAAVRDTSGRMTLARIDAVSGVPEYLLPFSYNTIGFPEIHRDTVYFSASDRNDDRLFAYAIKSNELLGIRFPASEEALGYYSPAVTDTKFAWSTFTASGFKLVENDKALVTWESPGPKYYEHPATGLGITAINTRGDLRPAVPFKRLPVNKYPKATGLLNFHSIEPYIDDPGYSITLVGENILNTLQSRLSFTYDRNEQYKKAGFNAVYGALFPYLSAGVDYTVDRRARYRGQRIYWNEVEPGAGISVPLNLSKGRSFTYLYPGIQYIFNRTTYQGAFKDTFGSVSYSYVNSFLTFSHQVQKARQQLFPSFAQTVSLNFKSAVTHYTSAQLSVNTNLYLPGLLPDQSLVINAAFLQKSKSSEVNFAGTFPFSRGYNAENFYRMLKWGVNYHFSVFYPDKGFASIIYLLRIRANLFYDQTDVNDFLAFGGKYTAGFRSAGLETYFDTKWWNEFPASFGVRYSRLLDTDVFGKSGKGRWEIVLPVNVL